MAVGVQGRLRLPEPMLDDLHVQAVADEQRRQVVPEVVEAEPSGNPSTGKRAARTARSMAQVEVWRRRPAVTT
jgi:hypothetical protein